MVLNSAKAAPKIDIRVKLYDNLFFANLYLKVIPKIYIFVNRWIFVNKRKYLIPIFDFKITIMNSHLDV